MILERVEFHSFLLILAVLHSYGPGCLKFHSSIEYYDNSTWYMVLEGLKFHRSIVYFDSFLHSYVLECLEFHNLLQFYCYTDMTGLAMVDFDSL